MKYKIVARWWWHTPLAPALKRQRQEDFWEFQASLVYKSELQNRKSYAEKLCLVNKQTKVVCTVHMVWSSIDAVQWLSLANLFCFTNYYFCTLSILYQQSQYFSIVCCSGHAPYAVWQISSPHSSHLTRIPQSLTDIFPTPCNHPSPW